MQIGLPRQTAFTPKATMTHLVPQPLPFFPTSASTNVSDECSEKVVTFFHFVLFSLI
jgi:hypothetical protein